MDGYDETKTKKEEEEEPHFARLYAQMKGEYRDSLVIRQVSRSKSTSWSEGGVRAILSISLFLYFSIALLLYTGGVLFRGEWCIRQIWSSSIISSNITLASPITIILISTLL